MAKWGADQLDESDPMWRYRIPDDRNKNGGNYAWIQHYIYHLAPNGRAGFVMANGAFSCGGKYRGLRLRIMKLKRF